MSKLLVVDDDPLIADLIVYKLSQVGHEVHTCSDGDAGLAEARVLRPDLILVDWMMPTMSGIEFCQSVRASSDLADTPVILMTAKTKESEISQGLDAGANAYIAKPFDPGDLARRVATVLGAPSV